MTIQQIQIVNQFTELAGISSSSLKQAYLRENFNTEFHKRILQYALDPYKMFGVKSFETPTWLAHEHYPDNQELFRTLDALVRREIRGNKAKEDCELICAKYETQPELLRRILNKDIRCGVAATLVNKVFPKLIPDFKVALAEEYDASDEDQFPKLASIKYDGLRCIALVDESGVKFYSRNGLPITSAEHIKWPLAEKAKTFGGPVMFDGELKDPNAHFQETSGRARRKSEQADGLVYYIFDLLPLEEFQKRQVSKSQEDRWTELRLWGLETREQGLPFEIIGHVLVRNNEDVQVCYKAARELGHEGLILKDPEAPYAFRRSKSWVKLKDVKTYEGKVLGMEPGKGKYEGMMGALIVDFNGQPNRMGTGFSDLVRKQYWNSPHTIIGKMVEGAYHEETQDGNMRHSRFIKERPDLE